MGDPGLRTAATALVLLLLSLAATSCGAAPDVNAVLDGRGPTELVASLDEVPADDAGDLGEGPELAVYVDGTAIARDAGDGGWYRLDLRGDELAALVDGLSRSGLDGVPPVSEPTTGAISALTSTTELLVAVGVEFTTVRAPGLGTPGVRHVPAVERTYELLVELRDRVRAANVAYVPSVVRLLVTGRLDPVVAQELGEPIRAWPESVARPERLDLASRSQPVVFDVADTTAAEVLRLAEGASRWYWSEGGSVYRIGVRGLLPHEISTAPDPPSSEAS